MDLFFSQLALVYDVVYMLCRLKETCCGLRICLHANCIRLIYLVVCLATETHVIYKVNERYVVKEYRDLDMMSTDSVWNG